MAKIFSRALELATDQTNVDPDWSGIMECIDLIRGNEISTKDAANMIVKRMRNSNPHVVHHTLLLLEACMKNCGSQFHREVLSSRFLEELKEIITHNPPSSEVSKKLLEMIQVWHGAFGNKPQFTSIKDVHTILQVSGYQFPAAKESDYMFAAQCAPDWVDGEQCFRCRADFTLFKRKHHCRACGQIFCDSCSSRQMYLPQFGIEKNVRVCETCFEKTPSKNQAVQLQNKKSDDEQARREKELEDKFQEDLQLALALSQSVSNQSNPYTTIREEVKKPLEPEQSSYYSNHDVLEDSVYRGAAAPSISNDSGDDRLSDVGVDSVLARYLDRDYWQRKLESNVASGNDNIVPEPDTSEAFLRSTTPTVESISSRLSSITTNNFEDSDDTTETKNFCSSINELVDTLENRMRSNALRGRSIVNDNAVHSLFVQLTEKHANIIQRMNVLEESRTHLEQMQDNVVHIQDARSAIDTLRQEHERLRQEQLLAAQRLRQQQMQHTLQYMRWQKTMSLESRRAEALKRFHEQERSMYMDRFNNGSPFMPQNQPPTSMPPQEMYQQPHFFQSPQQQQQIPQNSGYPVNFNGSNHPFEQQGSIPTESLNQQQFYQQQQMPQNSGYPANFSGSVPFETQTSIQNSEQMNQQPQFFQPQHQIYQPPVQQYSGPPEFQQMTQPKAKFLDGYEMPLMGLGTYKIVEQKDVNTAVDVALSAGYRLFDTAKYYNNEPQLGEAFKEVLPKHGLERKDVFITTKIWPVDENNYELTLKGVEESLVNLQTEYVDLMLIHYPKSNGRDDSDKEENQKARRDMWKALTEAKNKGQIRSIGVSNFEPKHILELKEVSPEVPVLNQVEFHPHFTRTSIREFCEQKGIVFQAYSALARQNENLINEPILKKIADNHNVSVSIVLLSFIISQGYSVVAKSATPNRIAENFSATKLKLSKEEINEIYTLNKDKGYIRGTPWLVL